MAERRTIQEKVQAETLERVKRIEDALVGSVDGKTPGLIERVRTIEDQQKTDRENRQYYTRLFVGFAMANIVSLMATAFMWFVKIYPMLQQLDNIQKAKF